MEKQYLAIVHGTPAQSQWTCTARLGPDRKQFGRIRIDTKKGKPAETAFRVLHSAGGQTLVEARPVTGRTHQIRVHLLAAGHPVVGDVLYGPRRPKTPSARAAGARKRRPFPLALRAVALAYPDPFLRKRIRIQAPTAEFLVAFGMPIDRAAQALPALSRKD